MTCILDRVIRSRDPEARQEAVSYCGQFEECSGSGRHGMTHGPKDDSCPTCLEVWKKRDNESLYDL